MTDEATPETVPPEEAPLDIKQLVNDPNSWVSSSGDTLKMCVVEELNPVKGIARQAVAVIAGYSLCREHLEDMGEALRVGYSHANILDDILKGRFGRVQ